jgi:AAA domain
VLKSSIPQNQESNQLLPAKVRWRLAHALRGDTVEHNDLDEPYATWVRAIVHRDGGEPQEVLETLLAGHSDADAIRRELLAADPDKPEPEGRAYRLQDFAASEALEPQPPPPWIVKDIVCQSGLTMFAGAPGAKKTWLVMFIAALVAGSASSFLGLPILISGLVVFVDEESGPRRFKRRLGQMMRSLSLMGPLVDGLAMRVLSLQGINLLEGPTFAELEAYVAEHRPVLLIFDALADLMLGGDENAVKDTQPVFMKLRRLAEQYQLGIIIIHHTNKQGGYRGSTAISGALDALFKVEAKANNVVEVTTVKARDTEPFKFAASFRYNNLTDTVDFVRTGLQPSDKATEPLSANAQRVLADIQKHGHSTKKSLFSGTDLSTNAIDHALRQLGEGGLVQTRGEPAKGGRGREAVYELASQPANPEPAVVAHQPELSNLVGYGQLGGRPAVGAN